MRKIVHVRHVRFYENEFPAKDWNTVQGRMELDEWLTKQADSAQDIGNVLDNKKEINTPENTTAEDYFIYDKMKHEAPERVGVLPKVRVGLCNARKEKHKEEWKRTRSVGSVIEQGAVVVH